MEKKIKEKLCRRQGLSTVELLCIFGMVAALILVIFTGAQIYARKSATGNDRLAMETAKSIATTNLHTGGIFSDGSSAELPQRGYFDPVYHTIVANCPEGYNDGSVVTSDDGTLYTGAPDTLVICVEYDGEGLRLFWAEEKK